MSQRILEASLSRGTISCQEKGSVTFELVFTSGFTVHGELEGNGFRDLAGRELHFSNPHAEVDDELYLDLSPQQTGRIGELTAARKIKVLPPASEVSSEQDHSWTNSLYFEWFSHQNGRVCLEATNLTLTLSEAAWEMSKKEEVATQLAASAAFSDYLDGICCLKKERAHSEKLSRSNEQLDEFAWEKTLQFSERLTARYCEALEKFGPDGDAQIDELMDWQTTKERNLITPDNSDWTEQEIAADEFDCGEDHPLNKEALAIIEEHLRIHNGLKSPDTQETRELLSIVAAKLAGALSCLENGVFTDCGFTIANLKRVLIHIDDALRKSESVTSDRLLQLRQNIIDLQQELRRQSK